MGGIITIFELAFGIKAYIGFEGEEQQEWFCKFI